VFNPSTLDRFTHVICASWITGAFFVLGISSWYIVKNKHIDFAKASIKIALPVAIIASLLQLATGHSSAVTVAKYQPAKLAAFEGHFETGPGTLYSFGVVNTAEKKVSGLGFPGMLSWMVYFNPSTPLKGLNDFNQNELPPIQLTFQTYHLMVAIGMFMIALLLVAAFLWWRGKLFDNKWLFWVFIPALFLPHIASLTGWISAEVGRQPWVVQNILKTKDAISKVVSAEQVWFSLIMFTLVYIILGILFVYLVVKKVKQGPEEIEEAAL